MAVKLTPPEGFLKTFAHPVWQKLGLSYCKAISLVEGQREGIPYTILALQHRGVKGLLAGENGATQVSTVFIVPIPDPKKRWKVTRSVTNFRVWVDERHVYLIDPGEEIPVAQWDFVLEQALDVVDRLAEVSSDEWQQSNNARYANYSDSNWIGLYLFFAGALTIAQCLFGPYYLYALFTQGFIQTCDKQEYARLGYGWIAWAYAVILCLPWLGHVNALRAIWRHKGHDGFALRMIFNTLMTIVLGWGILVPDKHIFKTHQLPNQTKVACKSGLSTAR